MSSAEISMDEAISYLEDEHTLMIEHPDFPGVQLQVERIVDGKFEAFPDTLDFPVDPVGYFEWGTFTVVDVLLTVMVLDEEEEALPIVQEFLADAKAKCNN